MESVEYHQALAALQWQVELGANEAIGDVPLDRYVLPTAVEKPTSAAAPVAVAGNIAPVPMDAVAMAEAAARGAQSLEALRAAVAAFEPCELKKGARSLVFSDGTAGAPVMVIGEAPERDEDREGRPFVGADGRLLDKMLAAIGMGRAREDGPVYIANILPWRPPQSRAARPEELAMMRPFLMRHIALARPRVLVLLGNGPCQSLLGKRGIGRLRGQWSEVAGLPALAMFHPSHLQRNPEAKREAWADLLSLKARVRDG